MSEVLGKSPETSWGLWGILEGEARLVSGVSPSADLEGFFCRIWWTGAASHPARMGVAVSRLGPTAFVPLDGVAACVTYRVYPARRLQPRWVRGSTRWACGAEGSVTVPHSMRV